MLRGKIFVTGGGGYLARAIYRRAERENWLAEFTCYSRHEDLQTRLHQRFPHVRRILGDVRDRDRLAIAMAGHDIVIHAAALKRVPEAEENVCETVDINVQGSMNVAIAAHVAGVRTVIGISTDKACGPLNLYGASKMIMERIFGEANGWGDTRFVVTRYGNVVGSTGSIVPIFADQLRRNGKVTVTDPDMTRFWLSPEDAVDLIRNCVLRADRLAGAILIPQPGAMRIGDLARLIAGEAPIEIIGPRPGEKKHEALISEYETSRARYTAGMPDHNTWIVLYPPGEVRGATERPEYAYSSEAPDFWIEPADMLAMIEDAATI